MINFIKRLSKILQYFIIFNEEIILIFLKLLLTCIFYVEKKSKEPTDTSLFYK